MTDHCRVYWGTHGCEFERGHHRPHRCHCCICIVHNEATDCAGGHPYYGPDTKFYGEDYPEATS